VIESALYFILGFLSAALLVALVAPSIWRRAAVLTRRRIETEVPLTLNQIAADKDALRAEHAVAVRKLEMRLRELGEKHTEQKLQFAANYEKLRQLTQVEREVRELRARENEWEETAAALAATQQNFEQMRQEFEALRLSHNELSGLADTLRIEIAVRETELDKLMGELDDMRHDRRNKEAAHRELSAEAKAARAELASEKKRNAALEKRLARLLSDLTDAREKLERRESELAALKKAGIKVAPAQVKADAKLREEIRDLAADVVALAAEREGPESPVYKALEQAEGKDDAGKDSLARRIRQKKKGE
jgi:chromosome segregation ATPase